MNPLDKNALLKLEKEALIEIILELSDDLPLKINELERHKSKIEWRQEHVIGLNEKKYTNYEKYNPKWTGIEKVLFILKQNNRVMTSAEIRETILVLEPYLKEIWEGKFSAVSKYISKAVQSGNVIKKHVTAIGYTYGLVEWLVKTVD